MRSHSADSCLKGLTKGDAFMACTFISWSSSSICGRMARTQEGLGFRAHDRGSPPVPQDKKRLASTVKCGDEQAPHPPAPSPKPCKAEGTWISSVWPMTAVPVSL